MSSISCNWSGNSNLSKQVKAQALRVEPPAPFLHEDALCFRFPKTFMAKEVIRCSSTLQPHFSLLPYKENRMRLRIRQTNLLKGKNLFRGWNTRAALVAMLAIALSGSIPAVGGWQSSTSAHECAEATTVMSNSPGKRKIAKLKAVGRDGSSVEMFKNTKGEDDIKAEALLPGDLDITFGIDGTVTTDLGNNLEDSSTAVAVQTDGKVLAVGYISTASTGKDFAVIRLNPDGTLDNTFSDDGKLIFNFNSATRDDIARAVAIQPDGKILIAGEADVLGFGNFDIVLARLNTDGAFDASFGNNGKVTTNLPNSRPDYGRALALQPDGRILVAGYSNRPTTGDDFALVRYNSNGSLDTSFDGDGIVTTDILTNREDRATSVALQSDGRIVIAGYTNNPSFKNDFAVVRYNTNGSLDSSFNGTGKVTTDLNLNSDDIGNGVTMQSDGKIVVAGQSADDFGVVRYNSNGSLDPGFGGGDGIVNTNFGSGATDIGRAVVVQSNGKITVAGRSRSELAFARYNADGTPDTSFDVDGRLVQNAGNNYISGHGGYWGMALQADGKIVAAGDGWRDGFGNDFVVSRLNANGTFDATFGGGDGIASTDINGRFDEPRSVAIQPDGKIVVAGAAQNSTGGYDFALVRYNIDGTLDTSFDGDGIAITDINGHGNEGAYAVALQPDGKILVAGHTNDAADGNLDDGVLMRYNPNGSLDSAFGSGGKVIVSGFSATGGGAVWLRNKSIALQPNGGIVVAGEAHYFSVYCDAFVSRYNPNGTFDNSFGIRPLNATVGGFLIIDFNVNDTFNAVALQADGKIVAAGSADSGTSAPSSDFVLARLNPNGTLDTSFDGDGKVFTNFDNNNYDAAYDLAIQADGKLVAVGETVSSGGGSDFAIARYNPNGSLDTTFGGGDGMANIDFNKYRDYCSGVALQPDGKIILAGFVDDQTDTGYGVVKLNQNGTFDTTFGGGSGRVRTLFGDAVGPALSPGPNDMALQADGKIVVVGKINFNSTDNDFTVVRYQNTYLTCTYTLNPTGANFTASGENGSFNVAAPSGCAWTAQSNAAWLTSNSSGDGNGTVFFSVGANSSTAARSATLTIGGQPFNVTQQGAAIFQFASTGYASGEGAGSASVVVTRSGYTASAVSVDYATTDGTARQRSDYTVANGTLNFAAGEVSQSFAVPLIDNAYVDGSRTVNLALSNPAGASLGSPGTAVLTITDNDSIAPSTNPADNAQFFVRQQYADFLNRVPDADGLGYWSNEITKCGTDAQCIHDRRVGVADAFFFEPEFQQTGAYVYRVYKAATGVKPTYLQFISDRGRVVVGSGLDQSKTAFALNFVQRDAFLALYPRAQTADVFVDALLNRIKLNSGADLSIHRSALISMYDGTDNGRAAILRQVADSQLLIDAEYNSSFVLMEYFGYMRRDPDQGGYDFWLGQVNRFPLRDVGIQHAMACSFITSAEYQTRFSSVVTHTNRECPQ